MEQLEDIPECTVPAWFTPGTEGWAITYRSLLGENICLGDDNVMVICSTKEEAEQRIVVLKEVFQLEVPEDALTDWEPHPVQHRQD